MNDVEPKDRDIAMVFQSYALYPHMTVYENMAFALKLRKVPKEEIDKQVREAAEILDITQYLDRKPKALSGGQRQRVAIGRAIVREPKVFLMDEPLSNLDAKLRNQMRAEIIKLRQRINTTFIYVTHDQTEAMTLGDRIVIMKDGFIQQIGTPRRSLTTPSNLFVAGFIGTPQMNFFDGKLRRRTASTRSPWARPWCLGDKAQELPDRKGARPMDVIVGIRPEHISFAAAPGADHLQQGGRVREDRRGCLPRRSFCQKVGKLLFSLGFRKSFPQVSGKLPGEILGYKGQLLQPGPEGDLPGGIHRVKLDGVGPLSRSTSRTVPGPNMACSTR